MTTVYILQNQNKLILNKQREWTDGRELNSLYRTPHKDEAINQKVEVNSKDYTQRISLLECELNEKSQPIIDSELLPEPIVVNKNSDVQLPLGENLESASTAADSDAAEPEQQVIAQSDLAETPDADPLVVEDSQQ